MKIKKLFFLLMFFPLLCQVKGYSVEGQAYHGSHYMKMQPGARANAIGPAYYGLSDDVYTLYYNPAGLVAVGESGFFGGASWQSYENITADAGFIFSSKNYAVGLGAMGSYYSNLKKYDDSGNESGGINNAQGYGIVGLSFFLTDFSAMGFSAKAGYRKIEDATVYGLVGNMGLMLQFFYVQFTLGLNNLGASYDQLRKDSQFINPDFYFGVSYTKSNDQGEKVFGVSLALERAVDLPDDEMKFGIGTFIRLWNESSDIQGILETKKAESNAFFFNLGIKDYYGVSFSSGFSLHLWGLKLDYALVFPNHYQEDFSHYGSVEIQF